MHGSRTAGCICRSSSCSSAAPISPKGAPTRSGIGPKSLEDEIAELKAAEAVDSELDAMKAALAARHH